MKSFIRIASATAVFLVPALALAAVTVVGGSSSNGGSFLGISFGGGGVGFCTSSICGVAQTILYIINSILVPVLFAIAFIVFLYGIARAYIFSGGEPEKVSEGHKLVLWGIIAFAVMISVWGLVNVVANTFGLSGYYAPPTPSSISPYGAAVPSGTVYGQQTQYIECPKDASGRCI